MTDVTVINSSTSVAVATDYIGPAVVVEVIGQPVIQTSTLGIQGPAGSGGGAGVTDGDKGDIVVSGSGAVWSLDSALAASIANGEAAFGYGNHATVGYLTSVAWGDVSGKPTLFSGAYADLTGKPTLFDGAYASLTGKPTLFDGAYGSLSGLPTLGTAAATSAAAYATAAQGTNADTAHGWGNHALAGYITSVSWAAVTGKPSFATVATTGAYTDLTGKPTLGSAAATDSTAYAAAAAAVPAGGASGQVLAKTSATDYAIGWVTPASGGAVAWADVTGKPSFATVATSGAYADLSGLPTLFDGAYASLTGKPTLGTASASATTDFAAASHTHTASSITDFASAVSGNSAVTANTAKVTNATHTGDVTGSTALTIASGAVSFAKMASVATLTVFGRVAASTGVAKALTATELTTIPNVFSRTLKGLVPASGGTSAITAFLCEDGTFRIPNSVRSDNTGITGADAVTNMVSLTTAEYAAIGSKDATTVYLITDAV